MKTQHTPGPWRIHGVTKTTILNEEGKEIYDGANYQNNFEEAKANAKLIAAAPELLEALKNLVEYLGEDWQHDQFLINAQEAINKATN